MKMIVWPFWLITLGPFTKYVLHFFTRSEIPQPRLLTLLGENVHNPITMSGQEPSNTFLGHFGHVVDQDWEVNFQPID